MYSGAVPWIFGAAVLALTLFSAAVLNDGDTFSHIAAGNWMLLHRAVPHTDPFSFTRPGAPWVAHEWLAELIFAAAYWLDQWNGVVLLTASAAALAFCNLARHLSRWLPAGATLLLLCLAAACVAPGLLARPHILALPVFEFWVAGLFSARAANRPPAWQLLPAMTLWANLHGGFILGLLLVVPLALEAILAQPPARWRVALGWSGFLAAAVVAASLTPNGISGLLFPFQLNGMAELSNIGEWQPTNFATPQPLELVLVAGLYVALTRGARLPLMRLLILLGLLHMALQHTRHQLLVGVIVPLLIAEPLAAALPRARAPTPGYCRAAALAGMAALVALRLALPLTRVDGPTAPITAVAHLPPGLAGEPVFNDYLFGGYLIFAGIRPFIDGRADMYGPGFLRQYAEITAPDKTAMGVAFRQYGVRWTILAPSNPAVALLDTMPNWCRFYADDVAVIHTPCGATLPAS